MADDGYIAVMNLWATSEAANWVRMAAREMGGPNGEEDELWVDGGRSSRGAGPSLPPHPTAFCFSWEWKAGGRAPERWELRDFSTPGVGSLG